MGENNYDRYQEYYSAHRYPGSIPPHPVPTSSKFVNPLSRLFEQSTKEDMPWNTQVWLHNGTYTNPENDQYTNFQRYETRHQTSEPAQIPTIPAVSSTPVEQKPYSTSTSSYSPPMGKWDMVQTQTQLNNNEFMQNEARRLNQELESNLHESRGDRFNNNKWESRFRNDQNRTYWQNQAQKMYDRLSDAEKQLIDPEGTGIDLGKVSQFQKANGLEDDGKFGQKTLAMIKQLASKKQKGGTLNSMQEQIIQLVKAAAAGDEKATQQINQIMDAAQKGDRQAIQIAQIIQQVVQAMKNQGIKAKYGAKLTQVRKLKGLCADDEELVYLKQGGRVCPVCQKKMKKAQEGAKVKKNAIEEFKNSRKQHVNPDDTVHVKPGVPRSLVNSDGSVVDKRFPAYSAEEYQRDLKTKDGRKRVLKQDIIASKCGGKTKKR